MNETAIGLSRNNDWTTMNVYHLINFMEKDFSKQVVAGACSRDQPRSSLNLIIIALKLTLCTEIIQS